MPTPPDPSWLLLSALVVIAFALGRRARTRAATTTDCVPHSIGERAAAPTDATGTDPVGALQWTVEQLQRQVAELDRRRTGADAALVQQVRSLERTTSELATALRSPKARGAWGELHLRRVVEAAGMLAHCDFTQQPATRGDDGALLRPDLVVHLASGRRIVVDAKAPLEALLTAREREGDARDNLERAHAEHLRSHVRALASKRYAAACGSGVALVVLFLPSEDMLRIALEHEPALLEHAARSDIALATPTTLIAILRGVAQGWQERDIAEHAERIGELGACIHERIVVVNEHLVRLGRALDASVRSFDDTVGSVRSRLVPAARELERLHAASRRDLAPVERIDRAPRVPSSS